MGGTCEVAPTFARVNLYTRREEEEREALVCNTGSPVAFPSCTMAAWADLFLSAGIPKLNCEAKFALVLFRRVPLF